MYSTGNQQNNKTQEQSSIPTTVENL